MPLSCFDHLLSPSLLLRLNEDVLSVKMSMGDIDEVKDLAVAVEVVRLYWVSRLPKSKVEC